MAALKALSAHMGNCSWLLRMIFLVKQKQANLAGMITVFTMNTVHEMETEC